MTTIIPPTETSGTQKLKQQNRKHGEEFRTHQLEDSTAQQNTAKHRFRRQSPNNLRQKREDEQQPPTNFIERRQHDRRNNSKPVMLDTRSKHDRRKTDFRATRKNRNAEQDNSTPQYGIDTSA